MTIKLNNEQFGEFTPDNLISIGGHPIDIAGVTVKSGQGILKRGSVIGIDNAGLAILVVSTAVDGSQVPYGILTDDVDTGTSNVVTTAYISGTFNAKALTFGGTDTVGQHREVLREKGIFLKEHL